MPVMGRTFSGSKKIMVFIDGGYIRKQTKDLLGSDQIKYGSLVSTLVSRCLYGDLHPQLIRAFYYDAEPKDGIKNVKSDDEARLHNNIVNEILPPLRDYFDNIRKTNFFDVRLGELIITSNGSKRQKGVDTLIAIDMITKAFQNQYDEAILIAGDRDFVKVVEAVKHIGPIVSGAYFENHISEELKLEFDRRFVLTKNEIKLFV